MQLLNVEIKAKSDQHHTVREILTQHHATYNGTDHQVDTYFNVMHGRLKLREGTIENNLIHYHRENSSGPKQSIVTLYNSNPESTLKTILMNSIGILTVVDKSREIYYIDNVKFHIDTVQGLGTYIEIEAIDQDGSIGQIALQKQCEYYLHLFGVNDKDLLAESYSDMILSK